MPWILQDRGAADGFFLHSVEKFGAAVGGWAKLTGAFGEVFCLSCVWNSWILLLFCYFFVEKGVFLYEIVIYKP